MRILRLDFGSDIGSADLHPFISVVHGLDEVRCSRLVSAIRSLVSGSGTGLAGLVEHGGHLVEVTPATVGDLGPFTTEDIVLGIDRLSGSAVNLPALLAERDQLEMAARIDAVCVEEVRADLVPSAAARVQRLRDQLDGVAAVYVDHEAQELRQTIRAAIHQVDSTPPKVVEVPAGIEDILADWEAYQAAERGSSQHLESIADRVRRAEMALSDALRFLADAEADAKPQLLSPEDEDRLEELAHGRLDGRRFRGKDKSPETDGELAALLAKVNQPTYSAYAMFRLSPTAPAEKLQIVDTARAQVETANAELESARAAMSGDDLALDLAGQLDWIKERARHIFGPVLPNDLGRALRDHVIETPNPDWIDAIRDLYDRMEAVGIEIPDDLDPEQLALWADDWLIRQEQADAAAGQVDPALVHAELEIAEAALDRHARAMARIDRLETKAAESRRSLEDLNRSIRRVDSGEVDVSDAVYEGIVHLTERVRANAGVSIPVVIRGNFTDLNDADLHGLFDRIEPLAQSVQIVVVTDRNAAAAWAKAAGLRRALCAGTLG